MDARFKTDEGRLKLRVSGIIIHDNKILLETYEDNSFCLPGGTINLNEDSEDAIKRELLEETDQEFIVDELVSINEEFYTNFKDIKTHCINFYYKMKFKNEEDAKTIDLDRLENDHGYMMQHHYKWIELKNLKNMDLMPIEIRDEIINNEYKFHHIIKEV
ncbi:MAG: NUDIX domain-containing protein [Bacilli bacterium]|nr:NUDIX domain-containing protein [Bacilli bacterium]